MSAWFTKNKPHTPPGSAAIDVGGIETTLKSYIVTKSRVISSPDEIDRQTALFSSGLLDSLAFVDLVLFVEKTFQVKLARVIEINMTSLDSIGQISDAVLKDASTR